MKKEKTKQKDASSRSLWRGPFSWGIYFLILWKVDISFCWKTQDEEFLLATGPFAQSKQSKRKKQRQVLLSKETDGRENQEGAARLSRKKRDQQEWLETPIETGTQRKVNDDFGKKCEFFQKGGET